MGYIKNPGVWQLWDDFGITESEMVGWWREEAPVQAFVLNQHTRTEHVYVTSYVVPGKRVLLAIATWAQEDVDVRLSINWTTLGLDPEHYSLLTAPAVAGLQ